MKRSTAVRYQDDVRKIYKGDDELGEKHPARDAVQYVPMYGATADGHLFCSSLWHFIGPDRPFIVAVGSSIAMGHGSRAH